MKLLVIGKTGQLARAITAEAPSAVFLDRQACDLSWSADDLSSALTEPLKHAEAVILAAAYTAVDQAESDEVTAHAVNAVAPGIIAELTAERELPLVHVSTDYVFKGQSDTPYHPDNPTDPINVYGQTKRDGEIAVLSANPRAAILRTSWVYDAAGKNFMTTMLKLGETRDRLTIVSDQIGRPTFAPDLAGAALRAAQGLLEKSADASGLFHVSNSGPAISWADFARTIFERAERYGATIPEVVDIPSRDYPTPATRPAYSVLDLEPFERAFDFQLPDWSDSLDRAISQYFAPTDPSPSP